MLDRLRYGLRALFRPGTLEREMQDEMRLHLEQRIAVLVTGGMQPHDARLVALREFGNVGVLQEEGRDARGTQWLDTLLGDIRFALRHFRRRRAATATIVAVLSLGITLHAVELTLVRIVTVRPPPGISSSLPLARVRGLVVPSARPTVTGRSMSHLEIREIAALDGVFESLAISAQAGVVAGRSGQGDTERSATAQFVNDDYFSTLGVRVERGPGLPRSASAAPGAELVAVVSEFAWEHMLGRPDSVGQDIVVNGRIVRVVGVAPPRFAGSIGSDDPGVTIWMPLQARPLILAASGASAFALQHPDSGLFEVVGRLRDGVSADSATRAVRVASAAVSRSMYQPTTPGIRRIAYDADAVYLRGITSVDDDDLLEIAGMFAVFSTLILLVVCTNVSGLMAASAATRGHEIAVRLSLGATRGRIVRQLLTESCILSLAGAAVGVFMYGAAFRLIRSIPEAQYYSPDLGTVALTLVSAVGVGILFGLTPALHAARGGVRNALAASGGGATGPSRLQRSLVTAQVALSQPLLVGIGAVVWFFLVTAEKRLPDAVNEQVVKFELSTESLGGQPEARAAALQRMSTRIREVPGVVSVLPDAGIFQAMRFSVPASERPAGPGGGREITAGYRQVRPGFFALLDVPLLRGDDRVISDSTRSIVIGTDLTRLLFGDTDPVGRQLEVTPKGEKARRYLVTGVYDSRLLGEPEKPVVYGTVREWWPNRYLVRTSRPAGELMIPIRRAIGAELPSVPIQSWRTAADEQANLDKQGKIIGMTIAGGMSVVLLIACIGLYGVVSLAVVQRQREIGIRMALGARAREVVALFYRSGMKLSLLGLAFGLPVSLVGARLLAMIEDEVGQPNMLIVGVAVGAVMVAVATLATIVPARRAAGVDPVRVLRSE